MSKTYEIILVSFGDNEKKILTFIENYTDINRDDLAVVLQKLPAVLRKTNSSIEAKIIKSQLEAIGAVVEIRTINEDERLTRQSSRGSSRRDERYREASRSTNNFDNDPEFSETGSSSSRTYRSRRSRSMSDTSYYDEDDLNRNPVTAWSQPSWFQKLLGYETSATEYKLYTSYDITYDNSNPIRGTSGCLTVIITGFLLVLGGIIAMSRILI